LPAPDDEDPKGVAAATATHDEPAGGDSKAAPDDGADKRPSDKPAQDAASMPTAPASSGGGGPSAFAYVLGGVGLLGVGAGALLTYWGKTDNDALAQCAPNCLSSSVDHVRTMYLAADVSFGVGAVLLGAATWMFATSHSGERPIPAAAPSAAILDLEPTRSGAIATVRGAF